MTALLTITAPPSWSAMPSGRSWCACGYERHAIGRAATLQLIENHTAHRDHCPLLAPVEGRNAA
ncbi:hypothetical protein [Streptomyces sp. NBC_01197]|uniref:hypothetical protein n=1 Tax=Streptomyces sp. NBC_01197 TaxID=2903768 RepID=UPI002E10A498|nr:hypothetical protein OG452_20940 [Streptomyces sp. NBC_01197]